MGKQGRPLGLGKVPNEFKDRFQKFYYAHREDLNEARRARYEDRRLRKLCVRCGKKSGDHLFCRKHRVKLAVDS
jgi:hypothetical protein